MFSFLAVRAAVCDVVALLFYFDKDGEGSIEFGHFGVVFAEDCDGFVMEFLEKREVGSGEIGGGFSEVVSKVCVHDVVCCADSSLMKFVCLLKKHTFALNLVGNVALWFADCCSGQFDRAETRRGPERGG